MPGAADQTLRPFLWRAATVYPENQIISRTESGLTRYGYREYEHRVAKLAHALSSVGVTQGDRVGTFGWNHHRHFETYFAVPNIGAQLHTINPLLPEHHIEFIVDDAHDRLLFVDPSLLDRVEGVARSPAFSSIEQYVVMSDRVPDTALEPVSDYESFIRDHPPNYEWPDLPETQSAGMCYTSGTTGQPKGVEYTHQMLWAHTMVTLTPHGMPIDDRDVVMPVVPMFHVNAWGIPFAATAVGSSQVFPGPAPDPADLAGLIEREGVTMTAGVPTVWLGLLEYVKEHEVDLSPLDRIFVGGSAVPDSLINEYADLGVSVIHAWGMTEMTPLGTVSYQKNTLAEADPEVWREKRIKQGVTVPGLEFRVVDDEGEDVRWDGDAFGELWVKGPWVTTEYFERPEANETDFEGEWLKTGDVVTVDDEGYIQIIDRVADVIKSGGEWISSQTLENTLMGHDEVSEAAVIGVSHDRWGERPVGFVVPRGENIDQERLNDELFELIEAAYPRWWTPDEIMFIDSVPKTGTGKFDKKGLREQYSDPTLLQGRVPEDAAPDESE